ncbi:MAG: hypothetical protein Q4Q06_00015 [Bacteroidota bacterium]|nr:hypothetical protein [Bacteroidota bacterium]
MKILLFVLSILIYSISFAQDSLYSKALLSMEQQKWFEAEYLLRKAIENGEDKLKCSYELAWTHYSNKEFDKAIEVLTPFLKEDVPSDVYQLLGNAYDEKGNSYKAVDIYQEGLRKYPKAGNLFLEMGNIKYKEGNYRQALYWYEKGIEAEPMFASNYYRAAKVFLMSTEMVWGVLYGEIFMILESETERSKEFSKHLFESYKECIFIDKNKVSVNFNNDVIVYSDSFERKNLFPQVFDNLMQQALKGKTFLNIANLTQARKKFISLLYSENKDFDNPLFKYQKTLIDNGLFEAYNYYLFAYGNTKESSTWINAHKTQWNKLIKHLENNKIELSEQNCFTRYNME